MAEININEIGGKAGRLIEMRKAEFPVKKCFCIGTKVVATIIENQEVPEELVENVLSEINNGGYGFAVRSSAFGEDGELSWAGQFKSELYVTISKLATAILSCANQQNGDEVKAYASSLNVKIPKLALVVQEMIDPRIAGVIFCQNPVGNNDEIIIEVVNGVGLGLVDGTKQPTRYYVEPQKCEIMKQESGDGEVVELQDEQIRVIVDSAQKLSSFFGKPQDIEWAIDNSGQFYITQSRDITTNVCQINIEETRQCVINELSAWISKEGERIGFQGDVLSDQNIAEILTSHPCQMAFSLFNYLFAHGDGAIKTGRNEIGYEIGAELDHGFQILVGGQPRCSIAHDAFTYRIKGIPFKDYCRIVKHYLEQIAEDPKLANYPEIVLYDQNPSLNFLKSLFNHEKAEKYHQVYQEFFVNFKKHEEDYDRYCRETFIPEWGKTISGLKNLLDHATNMEEMATLFQEIADLTKTKACKIFVKGTRVGFFAFARLHKLLVKLFGDEGAQAINVLSAGIPVELNTNLLFSIKLAKYRSGEIGLEEIVQEFGHLGIHELEISTPRYRNQLKIIDELSQQIIGDQEEEYNNTFKKSEELKQELISRLGREDAGKLEKEIDLTHRYLSLREVLKFEFLRGYDLLRQLAVKIEKRLGWPEGLIFHLRPQEVFFIHQQTNQLRTVALERLQRREREKVLYIPQVVSSDSLDTIGSPPESGGSILRGSGATNLVTEGEAIIVNNSSDMEAIKKLKSGMILVTKTTDPAWVPMLSIITSKGGLVTEVGGILAHAAIYAREVGMAAVLNVPNATKLIKTGDKVRVNGLQGYVEIIN